MAVDIPGVLPDKINELYNGDMDIYLPVVESYLSSIPEVLDKMRSVSAQTLANYAAYVHGVKSTSDSIGAEEARKLAYELEKLAKAGDLSAVLEKNGALISCVDKLITDLKAWLAKQK
jgi:HPt (histidine-containing phosphotransfer) domain-containing protein